MVFSNFWIFVKLFTLNLPHERTRRKRLQLRMLTRRFPFPVAKKTFEQTDNQNFIHTMKISLLTYVPSRQNH